MVIILWWLHPNGIKGNDTAGNTAMNTILNGKDRLVALFQMGV